MSDAEDANDDLGAIAWPGFVDILSSVIIMFVFFVMIVASALYFHILIFKSKVLSEISESISSQSQAKELAAENRSLMKKIKEMTEKMKMLEEMSQDNDLQLFKDDSEFAESEEQEVIEYDDSEALVIFFGSDSISVTKQNQQLLNQAIQKYISKYSAANLKISLSTSKDPKSPNDIVARRLAVARLLNVRNAFLKTEIPPNQVVPIVKDDEQVNDSYNWVRIEFDRK